MYAFESEKCQKCIHKMKLYYNKGKSIIACRYILDTQRPRNCTVENCYKFEKAKPDRKKKLKEERYATKERQQN